MSSQIYRQKQLSLLQNVDQDVDKRDLNNLAREIGAVNIKTVSRASSYAKHAVGGSINYLNFKL